MTMIRRDDLPETPDWVPNSRAWDDKGCCPADCSICEDLTVPPNIILGGADD